MGRRTWKRLRPERGAKSPSESERGCPPPLVAAIKATSYGEVAP